MSNIAELVQSILWYLDEQENNEQDAQAGSLEQLVSYKFNCTSAIHISDPAFITQDDLGSNNFLTMAILLPCKHGEWVCEVHLQDEGSWGTRVGKLVAYHSDYTLEEKDSWQKVGFIGVDSGMAGVYDSKRLYAHDSDDIYDQACEEDRKGCIVGGDIGVVCSAGFGDGMYEVTNRVEHGVTVAVQIVFITEREREIMENVGNE